MFLEFKVLYLLEAALSFESESFDKDISGTAAESRNSAHDFLSLRVPWYLLRRGLTPQNHPKTPSEGSSWTLRVYAFCFKQCAAKQWSCVSFFRATSLAGKPIFER